MTILCRNIYEARYSVGPEPGTVVKIIHCGILHVKSSVTLLRVYIKWSLILKHIYAGGGNVTFVVYIQFAPNSDVSMAF